MPDTPAGRYPCDLHCHTTRSDGHDSPVELIDQAARLGMFALAITDHDVPPPTELQVESGSTVTSVAYAASRGVRLILGDEFSCDTYVDDVHICGYSCDWTRADFRAEVAAAKRSKAEGYEELCRRLTATGMPVDWETDVLGLGAADGGGPIRAPEEVQRKHIFEAMAARGHAPTWSDAKLIVRDNPELNVRRRKIDPCEAIALIHLCGGIAVLAHPYLIDEVVAAPGRAVQSRGEYVNALLDAGLDGIEARYTYDKTTYRGSLTPEEVEQQIRHDYAGRVSFFSGGSDYHADHKKGARQVRYLGERGLSVPEFDAIFGRS
jgi:3',5'-nucleoside bisphosphate phosphatase